MNNVMIGKLNFKNMNIYCFLFILLMFSVWWSDNAYAGRKLKAKVPNLCYECHRELKTALADKYVHELFKKGKCTVCHNSHVSNIKGLMNGEVDVICLNCHDRMRVKIEKSTRHGALRDGECTDCHNAHGGNIEHLLVEDEKTLCLKCHEEIKGQFDKEFSCKPFKNGECSVCHDSHASAEDDLMVSPPVKLCKKCHAPKCSVNGVSFASVVKDIDCTTCHTGHSSDIKGLIGPYGHKAFLNKKCEECHGPFEKGKKVSTKAIGQELCFSCHDKNDPEQKYLSNDIHMNNVKNPCNFCHDYHASDRKDLTRKETKVCSRCHEQIEKRTLSMNKTFGGTKCVPVREQKCFDCHVPMHSDLPFNFRADGTELCARCHESQHKITHPLGDNVIDPRNGKPVTCISCHSIHSPGDEFMLISDKKRALCILCHKM